MRKQAKNTAKLARKAKTAQLAVARSPKKKTPKTTVRSAPKKSAEKTKQAVPAKQARGFAGAVGGDNRPAATVLQ